MANFVSTQLEVKCVLYEELQGGAYSGIEDNGNGWNQKPVYSSIITPIRKLSSCDTPELGIRHGTGIY